MNNNIVEIVDLKLHVYIHYGRKIVWNGLKLESNNQIWIYKVMNICTFIPNVPLLIGTIIDVGPILNAMHYFEQFMSWFDKIFLVMVETNILIKLAVSNILKQRW